MSNSWRGRAHPYQSICPQRKQMRPLTHTHTHSNNVPVGIGCLRAKPLNLDLLWVWGAAVVCPRLALGLRFSSSAPHSVRTCNHAPHTPHKPKAPILSHKRGNSLASSPQKMFEWLRRVQTCGRRFGVCLVCFVVSLGLLWFLASGLRFAFVWACLA